MAWPVGGVATEPVDDPGLDGATEREGGRETFLPREPEPERKEKKPSPKGDRAIKLAMMIQSQLYYAQNAFLTNEGMGEVYSRLALSPSLRTPIHVHPYASVAAENSTLAAEMPWRAGSYAALGLDIRFLEWFSIPDGMKWLRGMGLFFQYGANPIGSPNAPPPPPDLSMGIRFYFAGNTQLTRKSWAGAWAESWGEFGFHATNADDPNHEPTISMWNLKLGAGDVLGPFSVKAYVVNEIRLALPLPEERPWNRRGWYGFGFSLAPRIRRGGSDTWVITPASLMVEYRFGYEIGPEYEGWPARDLVIGLDVFFFFGPS